MRRITLLIFFILVPLISLGQDLNGRWSGIALQKIGNTLFSFRMEVQITHKGNKVSGKMVSVQSETKNYSIHKFTGSLRNGKVKLNPTEIIKVDYPQTNFDFVCFRNLRGEIKIDEINNTIVIEGANFGTDIKYDLMNQIYLDGNCPPSTFRLYKKNEKVNQTIKEADSIATTTGENKIIVVSEKEIKLFTKTVKIEVWDNYDEDGDLINLYLNEKILFSELKVLKKGKAFNIELRSGENIIEVEALNEGTVSPNTSAIKIFVNNQVHEIILSAKKGERDSLKIILD